MPTFDEVIDVIRAERTYQHQKWDGQSRQTELVAYVAYMEAYLAELKSLHAHNSHDAVKTAALDTMRKVTALGVAALEDHGITHRSV